MDRREARIGVGCFGVRPGRLRLRSDGWAIAANCGTSTESVQTLHGAAAGDRLATTLTHAATGFVDVAPEGSAFAEQLTEFWR